MGDDTCTLEKALGDLEARPAGECSFWIEDERGEHCAVEEAPGQILTSPALAAHLLALGTGLGKARRGERAAMTGRPQAPDGRRSLFSTPVTR